MAYDYVKRFYKVNPVIGGKVYHTVTNQHGVIVRAKPSHGHYVRVRFEGEKHLTLCHPTELDYRHD